jgi:hypothetical protein
MFDSVTAIFKGDYLLICCPNDLGVLIKIVEHQM